MTVNEFDIIAVIVSYHLFKNEQRLLFFYILRENNFTFANSE
jgi:hypothetical protein